MDPLAVPLAGKLDNIWDATIGAGLLWIVLRLAPGSSQRHI